MKKVILMLVLQLAVCSASVFAAESAGNSSFDYNSSGFSAGYMMLNLGEFQTSITAAGYPALSDGLIYYGASSLVGFRDGLRFGGFGLSGETKVEGSNNSLSKLSISLGGANLDYGFVVSDNLDVALGLVLGGGGYELTLRNKALTDMTDPNQINLTNAFFLVGPRATMFYQVNEWLAVEGVVGYLYGLGKGTWKDVDLDDTVVPTLRINGLMTGITLNLSI